MPVGNYSKDQIREMAEKIGLQVANKPDSQDICFVPDGDYASFIEENADAPIRQGNFVTPDGKILKSSTVYIRNSKGKVSAILSINYDISKLLMVEDAVRELITTQEPQPSEPERIVNVNDLLEDLIEQSVALVGKPVALMNKDDKVKAIQFLNQNGAFLVTKSGDKIAKYFGISKYTLYSYIDTKQQEEKQA